MASSVGALITVLVDARAGMPVPPAPAVPADLSAAPGAVTARVPGDDHPLEPAELPSLSDELLDSPMLTHPDFVAEVRRWVRFWETAPAQWFPDYLARMTWFEEIVDTTLAAHGLPWSLRYLPVIESGYSPSAVSSASAVGMWQFMAPTAQDFDIEITRLVDDRRDPFVSTAAAADFLVRLRADFGSWFLALAAYNAGPDRIRGIIERHAPDAELSDALYWALRPYLPRETADFVPNLFGAIVVASDPEAHGYEAPEPRPFHFEPVPVLGRLTFDAMARATGTTREEIARLNPEYLLGVTPGEKVVEVRLPVGRGEAFRAHFAEAGAQRGGG
jgi:membrane-bound lytic murein transglycosylase D